MLDHPVTGILTHMQLHETANYFALDDVSRFLEEILSIKLSDLKDLILKRYPRETAGARLATQWHRGQPKPLELLTQENRDFLFQAIDHGFSREYQSEGIQQVFAEFVRKTNFWILHDEAFKKKLSSVPRLAASILDLMVHSELGKVFHTVPMKCGYSEDTDCGEGQSWSDLRLGIDANEVVVGYHRGTCQYDYV